VSPTTTLNSVGLAPTETLHGAAPWERRSGIAAVVRRPSRSWRAEIGALLEQRHAPRPALADQRSIVTAHRGGSLDAPESTLRAYRNALRNGADVLELDVHLSADGHVVVMHDPLVDRTTNGCGAVADLTLAELRKLNAGHWFVPGVGAVRGASASSYVFRQQSQSASVPDDLGVLTLDEFLSEFPTTALFVDLKGSSKTPRLQQAVAATLDRHNASRRVIVAALDRSGIAWLRDNAPAIRLAPPVLTSLRLVAQTYFRRGSTTGLERLLRDYDVVALPYKVDTMLNADPRIEKWLGVFGSARERWIITPEVVAAAKLAGKQVHAWVVNDPADMQRLIAMGVDSLTTDDPALAVQMWGKSVAAPANAPVSQDLPVLDFGQAQVDEDFSVSLAL